jgi:hypothetical protein
MKPIIEFFDHKASLCWHTDIIFRMNGRMADRLSVAKSNGRPQTLITLKRSNCILQAFSMVSIILFNWTSVNKG